MRRRLLLAAAALLIAGEAVAQVVTHDVAVQALMVQAVDPAAKAFWAGGNDPPEGETAAQAEARWAAAVQGAQTLQAKSRELMAHSRPGRWNDFAQLLADGAAAGEVAARAKDVDKTFEIGGGAIYDACNGCHKAYIPSPARLP